MTNNKLYFLVEGPDDIRFFKKVVAPELKSRYHRIVIESYSTMSRNKRNRFIESFQDMGFRCIYVGDFDKARCLTQKKVDIKKIIKISNNNIKIVKDEIESWYIAGASDQFLNRYQIKVSTNTENTDKEKFDNYIPIKMEKIRFMLKILDDFSVSQAVRRNHSFSYLLKCLG